MTLTRKQREILDFLSEEIGRNGFAPSFEEISKHFGYKSLATVHEHLSNLEKKGYIRRSYNESRAIEILAERGKAGATDLPLLGNVAAGMPIESILSDETLGVPDDMLPQRGANYALRVRGQSMVDEHITDGDMVVVNGRETADNGEMVIALVNGAEATVKRFYREPGGWIRLQPSNTLMRPVRVQERDVMIQGVVVGVIRKY
jgi:repressor LexA